MADVELAISRERGIRDSKDGKPFYCTVCGAGWNEYGACESVACQLEPSWEAAARHRPAGPVPAIVGYNVGDYSDIMDEPLHSPQATIEGGE